MDFINHYKNWQILRLTVPNVCMYRSQKIFLQHNETKKGLKDAIPDEIKLEAMISIPRKLYFSII